MAERNQGSIPLLMHHRRCWDVLHKNLKAIEHINHLLQQLRKAKFQIKLSSEMHKDVRGSPQTSD